MITLRSHSRRNECNDVTILGPQQLQADGQWET
jgi:hypothetical protein